MPNDFAAAMRRAALSIRACDVAEATRLIQDAVMRPGGGRTYQASRPEQSSPDSHARPARGLIDPDAEIIEPTQAPEPSSVRLGGSPRPLRRVSKPLCEVLRILREGRLSNEAFGSLTDLKAFRAKTRCPPPGIAEGAQFLTRSFAGAEGVRAYKLYIPACAPAHLRGLVVMLHGCKQDPDDFSAGTAMNAVAEAHGLIVAYPSQSSSANAASCWNWFNPADQMRGSGEPAIIAGITRAIASEFAIAHRRVFVAGLSAGGAMAAVMGETYPDLYAGVGIHSGLAYGSANDVMSAFAAMRGDTLVAPRARGCASSRAGQRVRMIVFQGNADRIVHPSNAERIVAQAGAAVPSPHSRQERVFANGRSYTRTIVADADGTSVLECWLIEGAGHAWSGGHPSGSFTDATGPHASAEMVRFFLDGP
jgi:poly(hydroxyalkanoate) depolymerase family esterase